MKFTLQLLAIVLLLFPESFAFNYAYVYIEGDKQTPFYVKLEGEMMPRLGMNYCILPALDKGVTNIEVLFQQNKYPPQKFALKIPEGGSRGFTLQKVNDRQFALYDLHSGNYLLSGNQPEEDVLTQTIKPVVPTERPVAKAEEPEIPVFRPDLAPNKTVKKRTGPALRTTAPAKEVPEAREERFIPELELYHSNTSGEVTDRGSSETSSGYSEEAPAASEQGLRMPCSSPMNNDDFERFALRILDKSDDDARIQLLKRSKGKKCFTTEQVRIMAKNLHTQSGRYLVTELLYPQTSDPENYGKLEGLFHTNYLKAKFKKMMDGEE